MARLREARILMGTPATEGIDLFKIAGRSISGWVPSFKMGATSPVKHPFCSQLEERLLLWLEYPPHVVSYTRGDIGPKTGSGEANALRPTMLHVLRRQMVPGSSWALER